MENVRIAGVEVLVNDNERYLQVNDVCVLNEIFWQAIKTRYQSYEIHFCYHTTDVPIAFLKEINAKLVDDCVEMRLSIGEVVAPDVNGIQQVTDANFNEFACLHEKCNTNIFWTSERVKSDLSRWGLFIAKCDNLVNGYIMIALWDSALAEIFCLEASTVDQGEALISSAVNKAINAGKTEVLYMVDKDSIYKESAELAGFKETGIYQGFMAKV